MLIQAQGKVYKKKTPVTKPTGRKTVSRLLTCIKCDFTCTDVGAFYNHKKMIISNKQGSLKLLLNSMMIILKLLPKKLKWITTPCNCHPLLLVHTLLS